jgi:hypothetical protein
VLATSWLFSFHRRFQPIVKPIAQTVEANQFEIIIKKKTPEPEMARKFEKWF